MTWRASGRSWSSTRASSTTASTPDFGEFQLRAREGDVTVPLVAREEPLHVQARAFLEALETDGRSPCDARAGADVVRVLMAINASIAANGAPMPIEQR